MKRIQHILLLTIMSGLLSCGTKWSKERKAKFDNECSQTTLLDLSNLAISFKGFTLEEVDTVRIVERNGEQTLATFFLYGKENSNYPVKGEADATCTRPLDIRYTYDFYFGGDKYPYILDSMKMGVHPEFKGMSEDYKCRLKNKRIDGEQMREFGNLTFTKRPENITNESVFKIITKTKKVPGDIDITVLSKISEPFRALAAFYSALGGTLCDGDYCKLTTALNLGKQGSAKHKELIKTYFPDDKVAKTVLAQDCYLRPSGANTFSDYEYLTITIHGDTMIVDYNLFLYDHGDFKETSGPDTYLFKNNRFKKIRRNLWTWAED